MIIYTNETCPYCKQVKEELNKNGIGYKEILTTEDKEEWDKISSLTSMPTVPTLECEGRYLVPGRDFRSANHLIDIIKNIQEFPDEMFSSEFKTMEKIKTLSYQIQSAFGRTDQLLRQIESKLNTNTDNEKV